MKLLNIAFITASVLMPLAAQATDLPSKKSAPPAPVVKSVNWAGLYAGVSIGGSRSSSDVANSLIVPSLDYFGPDDVLPFSAAGSGSISDRSFVASANIGYNWQNGSTVYGLVADISSLGFSKSRSGLYTYNDTQGVAINDKVSATYQSTLRVKLGYATESTLLYLTGGVAVATVEHSHNVTEYGTRSNNSDNGGASERATKLGWVVGVGADWALDQKWSLEAEYLHSHYSPTSGQTQLIDFETPADYIAHSADLTVDLVKIGLNYKF